jgi:simple sugar transport system ATP-binding protein
MEKETLLKMTSISKAFGAVQALQDVDLEVAKGEVIGLVGDNGAGKSTLMKILMGAYNHDKGEIEFKGNNVSFKSPIEARNNGIEIIYQDLALCEEMDIAGNLFLGKELTKGSRRKGLIRLLDKKLMAQESTKMLDKLKINIPDPKTKVKFMSGGQRKAVAIGRAVYWDADLTIMDEPTAALAVKEINNVLELIQSLKTHGVSVIFISHNLQEVFAVTDRIVVLRRGMLAGVKNTPETTINEIVEMMVGS